MIKTSEYYYIDYQYILVDEMQLYEEYPEDGRHLQDELNMMINNEHPFDDPLNRFYFGRINRLQFKLCHEYCETCYELVKIKIIINVYLVFQNINMIIYISQIKKKKIQKHVFLKDIIMILKIQN